MHEKFTCENLTLPTIHVGPGVRRPAWPSDGDDDDDAGQGDVECEEKSSKSKSITNEFPMSSDSTSNCASSRN